MTHLEIAISLEEFRAKTGCTEDANQTETERSADSSKTATLILIFFPLRFPLCGLALRVSQLRCHVHDALSTLEICVLMCTGDIVFNSNSVEGRGSVSS